MLPELHTVAFPEKNRRLWCSQNNAVDRISTEPAKCLIRARAPWVDASVQELSWSATVTFERRLATAFGRGRCWLAGDAAHQTTLTGTQSMNVGLYEAADLAETRTKILHRHAPWNCCSGTMRNGGRNGNGCLVSKAPCDRLNQAANGRKNAVDRCSPAHPPRVIA